MAVPVSVPVSPSAGRRRPDAWPNPALAIGASKEDVFRSAWRDGTPIRAIAERLGVQVGTVSRTARRLGLSRQSPIKPAADPKPPRPRRAPKATLLAASPSPAGAGASPKPAIPTLALPDTVASISGRTRRLSQRGHNSEPLRGSTLSSTAAVAEPEPTPRVRPARECCWPIGDVRTPGFRFCAAAPALGKPYCPEHCGTAYVRLRGFALPPLPPLPVDTGSQAATA